MEGRVVVNEAVPRRPAAVRWPARVRQHTLARGRRRPSPWLRAAILTALLAAGPRLAEAAPADSTAARRALPPPRVRAWQTGAIRADRLQHASLSFALAAAATAIGGREGPAFAGTLLLGVAKEAWDARSTRFDKGDLAAGVTGAALGTLAGAAVRR